MSQKALFLGAQHGGSASIPLSKKSKRLPKISAVLRLSKIIIRIF